MSTSSPSHPLSVPRPGPRTLAPTLAALLTPLLLLALFLFLLTPTRAAAAATLTVCPTGPAAYTTIQAAVAAATPGSTISLCAATYPESVDLSAMASPGDITLAGPDPSPVSPSAVIHPASGRALYLTASFPGAITLVNITAVSDDANAIDFPATITGSLIITGGGASQSFAKGLFAPNVEGSIVISGAIFSDNASTGLELGRVLFGPCPAAVPPPPTVHLNAVTASGNGVGSSAGGIEVYSYSGSILVEHATAAFNGADGMRLSTFDGCGSEVIIRHSRAEYNGDGAFNFGHGFNLQTTNAVVADAYAAGNVCNGFEQGTPSVGLAAIPPASPSASPSASPFDAGGEPGCSAPTLAAASPLAPTRANAGTNAADDAADDAAINACTGGCNGLPPATIEISGTSAVANGNHGFNLGAVDYVTITAVSALSNTVDGIRLPFLRTSFPPPPLAATTPGAFSAQGAGAAAMTAAIADSFIAYNAVGIELNHQLQGPFAAASAEASSAGTPSAGAASAGTSSAGVSARRIAPTAGATLAGNVVCDNLAAGLASTGNYSQTAVATSNYWGNIGGPFHTTKNPAGLGNQVVDAANPSTFPAANGDVSFSPFVATFTAVVSPSVGIVGSDLTANFAFGAGPLPGLTRGPGNPNDGPLFTVAGDRGLVTTAFGTGPTAPAALAGGLITATVVPTTGGPGLVFLNGPCGLSHAAAYTVLSPAVSVVKTAGLDPNACAPAGPVTAPISSSLYYCVNIANTGDVTLTHHLIRDPQLGIAAPLTYTLAPGASIAVTRSLVAGLGPILVTGSLTNAVSISSTAVLTEFEGVVIAPTLSVSAAGAASVRVTAQPTAADQSPEPAAPPRLYLPTLTR